MKKAQQLATKSGDTAVQAEVYAARGNAQLRNPKLSENAAITAAAVFISKGAELAPTNIAVSLALYRILKRTGNSRLADQIIDQVLLLEPSNWDALWIRYQAAKESGSKSDLASITQQLKFYYSSVPKVQQLPSS